MDVADDEKDVQLQKQAPELLADFEKSIRPFLWKNLPGQEVQYIRRRVRVRDTVRLVALLEPFLELPQLLDPHLQTLVPVLADAFLAYLRAPHAPPTKYSAAHTQLLEPLSRAICRILYEFCKIRGEKVIVRFFSTETRHLELLLSAIEAGRGQEAVSRSDDPTQDTQSGKSGPDTWEWEERYITLLWLSQLLLAPFDLASISSEDSESITPPEIVGFEWPENVPGLTMRVVPLAVSYLSSSGKERDSAKVLLVRLAMRRDMQELGIFRALVRWSMASLRTASSRQSTYYYIGVLSFMAGLLTSSVGTTHMDPFLPHILEIMSAIWDDHPSTDFRYAIKISVVARKVMIKILRLVSAIALQRPDEQSSQDILQDTVPMLLDMLSDAATPVRLAASKALSVITLKLDSDMASQLIEAILSSFEENVLIVQGSGRKVQDLSRVDPNQWHGLIMTLSHLLYRRSIPASALSPILEALRRGLSFEKKSSAGASMGTNVRDAANFGIWAMARRYSTAELDQLTMEPHDLDWDGQLAKKSSALQTLATELVIAASLDPAGNIRRGSSAALQELIGRHPNKVENGIAVVQFVDYHAVARRSRAIEEVASQASLLSQHYRTGLLTGLMGWRGVKDSDDAARRNAASAVANIMWGAGTSTDTLSHNLLIIKQQLDELPIRDVESRHGLILSLAEVFAKIGDSNLDTLIQQILVDVLSGLLPLGRRPDLIAEAGSKLILNSLRRSPSPETIKKADEILEVFMKGSASLDIVYTTSVTILLYLTSARRQEIVKAWIISAESTTNSSIAYINVLLKLFNAATDVPQLSRERLVQTMHKVWDARKSDLERREHILKGLAQCKLSRTTGQDFIDMINEGLDDYTTNARGDVGSNVRIAAAQAASTFITIPTLESDQGTAEESKPLDSELVLLGKLLRIAAEKLDKVRLEGQKALVAALFSRVDFVFPPKDKDDQKSSTTPKEKAEIQIFESASSSSVLYFRYLLSLQNTSWWRRSPSSQEWSLELMAGYVTSADTGSEDLVRASRAELVEFCAKDEFANLALVGTTLLELLRRKMADDRYLVPTLEVAGFLMDMGILQNCNTISFTTLLSLIKKSHFRTTNIRKLECCIKVYGSLTVMTTDNVGQKSIQALIQLLSHRYPRVVTAAVDELWIRYGTSELKGVDWVRCVKEGKGAADGNLRLDQLKRALAMEG